MNSEKKYHAFISYSHSDKFYARILQKSIETLGLPFYRSWQPNVNLFRDERKIPLAGSLTQEILRGLTESDYLIVIASKNSCNSRWVKEEIESWWKINKDEEGFITNFNFILIESVIEWDYHNHDFDKLKTTAFPRFETKIFKELPIWANLQHYCKEGKVLKRNANYEWEVAKIKGLLLGKNPDEIINEVSKGRRLFRITISIIMLALVLLSIFAFYQRSQAISQGRIAKKNARDAIIQRDSALYNLRQFKLEEFNRNFKNGLGFYEAQSYCLAKRRFLEAYRTAIDSDFNQTIRQKSTVLDSLISICNRYAPECN